MVESKNLNIALIVIIFVASLVYYLSYFNHNINLSDEGYLVYGAYRVTQGQIPGKDFHAYMPGRYYCLALFFKIFGVSILSERIMFLLLRILIAVFIFVLGRRILPGIFALFPAIVTAIVPGPWHKSFEGFFIILSSLVVIKYLETRNKKRLTVLSITCAVVILFRMELGLLVCGISVIVILFSLLKRNNKSDRSLGFKDAIENIGLFSGVFIITLLPYGIYLSTQRAFVDSFLFYKHEFAATLFTPSAGNPFLGLFPIPIELLKTFSFDSVFLMNLLFYFPLVVYLLILVYLIKKFLSKNWDINENSILILLTFGLFSFSLLYKNPDISHLLQCAPVAYILGAFLIFRAIKRIKADQKRNHFISLFVLIVISVFYVSSILSFEQDHYFSGSYKMRTGKEQSIKSDRVKVKVNEDTAEIINGALEYFIIHRNEENSLLAIIYLPMFNFITEIDNPIGYDIFFPHVIASKEKQRVIVEDISRKKVNFIIASNDVFFPKNKINEKHFRLYGADIYYYVTSNYRLEKRIGGFLILKRGMDVPSKYFYKAVESYSKNDMEGTLEIIKESKKFGLNKEYIEFILTEIDNKEGYF